MLLKHSASTEIRCFCNIFFCEIRKILKVNETIGFTEKLVCSNFCKAAMWSWSPSRQSSMSLHHIIWEIVSTTYWTNTQTDFQSKNECEKVQLKNVNIYLNNTGGETVAHL